MSIAIASASSRSAGPWACRRPRTTSAPPASAQPASVEDERLLGVIRETHRGQLRGLRLPADVEGAAAGRRDRAALPGAAADARARDPGREAAREAVAHHDRRSARARPAGSRRSATSPRRRPTGCGSAISSYLRCWEGVVYFAFVIDVFSRRVVGWQLAGHMRTDPRPRRAADGARDPRARALTSGWLHHTDRGSQYTSADYTQVSRRPPRAGLGRLGRRRL